MKNLALYTHFFHPCLRLVLAAAALALLGGCFGPLAKRLADKETYPLLEQKQHEALGTARPFSIEPTTSPLTRQVIEKAGVSADPISTRALTVSLADALALAVANNREYQTRKESVYLAALRLTGERHEFSPLFSGAVSARATHQPKDGGSSERFGTIASDLAVTKLFATGARVTVGLSDNFLRYYTGPGGRDRASGALTATAIQPLLQGAGSLVTLENLRQAERDVVYAWRAFERYQKRFVVDRVNEYYRLLQALDQAGVEQASYQRLVAMRERAEALEDAQRLARFQVDQARQDEIQAQNRWVVARTAYALALDQLKVNLGLPTELNIQPDPAELARLEKGGLVELQYDLARAERLALAQRLDLKNAQNVAEDFARRVKIAENSLLPALDARAGYAVADEGRNRPLDLDTDSPTYFGELRLELPLDRKDQRNAYRAATIAAERARRDADQLRNELLAQVRRAWQDVGEARQSYDIQQASLRLAEQRVDNVKMLMEVGRQGVSIRDQLEAETALRNARNARTRVLIDYTVARLEFYYAIEQLEVDEQGMWNEQVVQKS